MTKAELKPCPFCGGENVNTEGRTEELKKQLFCWDCGASGPHPSYDEVDASWNHRPAEQALVEALEMWFVRALAPSGFTDQEVLDATEKALKMAGAE